jgi:hypothetical protein
MKYARMQAFAAKQGIVLPGNKRLVGVNAARLKDRRAVVQDKEETDGGQRQ